MTSSLVSRLPYQSCVPDCEQPVLSPVHLLAPDEQWHAALHNPDSFGPRSASGSRSLQTVT
jgi:hypothetical protein